MRILTKTLQSLTQATRWIAMIIIFVMMALISLAVIVRAFGKPILGDVELVQFAMIVLIMFGLAYTQKEEAHVSIGLLVDKLSPRVQTILDIFSLILTIVFSWLISFVFYHGAVNEMTGTVIKSTLLSIPHYPFKYIIAIGLFLWGLESLFKIILTFIKLIKGTFEASKTEKGGEELWL
ncbi:TRAP-type C4-dicarboxylate transport system permease small subunit [Neobacillus niacini]|uniref:TRAP transporter small permease n=1 Tax=Neobacillus niacini TaxID=86668 RepID=UPI002784BE23|nr:TRAP transporter small permease [Neobacillus niacini]MDQ1002906.1 TRAP-type C4-dicarboxylate transport system permease small subunit [Neobacillus niacini]